jgi:DNA mismatch endonuclease (patch repair protein)
LAKTLWQLGYRYRRNSKYIFGKPDISFKKYKIAIFVDGEFFHGRNWDVLKLRLNTNKQFWHSKIERNIKRDIEVNHHLSKKGWIILRFWDSEVKKNLSDCVKIIVQALEQAKTR